MSPMYIPERTIDSLFAAEIVRYDPYALIWSPTQYRGSPDHELTNASGRVAIFECKGVQDVVDPINNKWTALIDVPQLRQHANQAYPILYLFLAKPPHPKAPGYARACRHPCCYSPGKSPCKQCARDARSWGTLEQHVLAASIRLKLQPWFSHWSWVITADDLQTHLQNQGKMRQATSTFTLDDSQIENDFPNASRLCHRFRDIRSGSGPADDWTWPLLAAASFFDDMPRSRDEDATPPTSVIVPGDE
ncbi:hypothetical protein [Brachybacterium paraconglomeratum]|uniref:hypothetical protein n=1 Tax=Brachybacterium paraconglomeratum TaxID=173362 RepID=UPI00249387E2|nr:hypothetical protein [Brachybacterium paraconglomeratum]